MYLMPTTLATRAEEKEFKSFGELLSYLEGTSYKIRRIWAVSAYYDRKSIEQLIAHIKNRRDKKQKPELFIVIGSINYGELEALQKMKFGNEFKEGSGIRVTKCGYLFHSKGYLVETTRSGMCAIGSMNLTQAGLKDNEEILTYSRYTRYSKVPPLVAGFRKYVEAWRSNNRSKEIGAVSEKEPGIRWMPKGWNESSQGNDYNGWLPPKFPVIADGHGPAVRRYFNKLGLPKLNDSNLVNEREFTLALYRLLFEECGKNPDECECKHDGVTLQYRDALWRRGFKPYHATWHKKVSNKMQHWTCSARFDVTLKGEELPCYIFVYLTNKSGIRLGICVRKKDNVVLQLNVSKDWEKSGTTKGQYWRVYHDGSMSRTEAMGRGVECKTTLRKVKARHKHWIKKRRGKELVYLDKLYVAKEVTWGNSQKFLARLLHYAIIREKIKSLAARSS